MTALRLNSGSSSKQSQHLKNSFFILEMQCTGNSYYPSTTNYKVKHATPNTALTISYSTTLRGWVYALHFGPNLQHSP